MKSERGFTLIEMLIVLLIISVLLILTIPNITKYNDVAEDKGCEAYLDLLQTEVQLYKIEYDEYPTDIGQLDSVDNEEELTCFEDIMIDENGNVIVVEDETENGE
ncbi:competence type IV pilus major pilin ComGC [Tenuibacillus multivorans]|uniref:Competence protein ComGC n=1 Tax=Tenuibacillus multivorans TaxID=237069 RepID=A0A1G9ZBU9_9BACI|nr:competence type IV pilus major pilin ComGC [Tenuibacillus multivorans]GEL77343.1 competence protein ComGC [Tenuibacillus multivorans]SDN17953.1 competence protein ComGC [Tenuibacillus multivorans]